jgi:hypothetical protein
MVKVAWYWLWPAEPHEAKPEADHSQIWVPLT